MTKRGGLYVGVVLLLMALISFISAKALSPLRQLSSYELGGEIILKPSHTPSPPPTAPPTLTLTPASTSTGTGTPTPPPTRPPRTPTPTQTLSAPTEPPGTLTPTLPPATLVPSPTVRPTEPPQTPTATKSLIPTNTSIPTVQITPIQPTNTLEPTPLPKLLIEAEYPERIETGQSDWIRVTLIRTQKEVWVATIESTEHVAVLATPEPVGTLEAPPGQEFGPEYIGCAIATLLGTSFEIEGTSDCQSLEQTEIIWEWNIKSKSDVQGKQVLNLRIDGQWESIRDGPKVQRLLFRERFEIEVTRPFIRYINFSGIISGIVGSGLSIPWLYERIIGSRKKKQKEVEDKPRILLP